MSPLSAPLASNAGVSLIIHPRTRRCGVSKAFPPFWVGAGVSPWVKMGLFLSSNAPIRETHPHCQRIVAPVPHCTPNPIPRPETGVRGGLNEPGIRPVPGFGRRPGENTAIAASEPHLFAGPWRRFARRPGRNHAASACTTKTAEPPDGVHPPTAPTTIFGFRRNRTGTVPVPHMFRLYDTSRRGGENVSRTGQRLPARGDPCEPEQQGHGASVCCTDGIPSFRRFIGRCDCRG